MEITLCVNKSEKNKLNKTLSGMSTFSGTLREETSVTSPVILIAVDNPTEFNYAYIPEFKRYYFISDMVSVRSSLWRISMQVDVLMSFKDNIGGVSVILSDSENIGSENYLSGDVWKNKVKELTDIINFPNGLLDNGEFILITAGG